MLHHRDKAKPRNAHKKPTSYTAKKANEVWSWDISYRGFVPINGIRLRECSPTEKKIAVFLIQNHPNFYHRADDFS
jgi:hypothetical protein